MHPAAPPRCLAAPHAEAVPAEAPAAAIGASVRRLPASHPEAPARSALRSAPERPPTAPCAAARNIQVTVMAPALRICSDELFSGRREVQIEHRGALYRLQQTSLGKLILTK